MIITSDNPMWWSYYNINKAIGISKTKLSDCLQLIEAIPLLQITRRHGQHGRNQNNVYTLVHINKSEIDYYTERLKQVRTEIKERKERLIAAKNEKDTGKKMVVKVKMNKKGVYLQKSEDSE